MRLGKGMEDAGEVSRDSDKYCPAGKIECRNHNNNYCNIDFKGQGCIDVIYINSWEVCPLPSKQKPIKNWPYKITIDDGHGLCTVKLNSGGNTSRLALVEAIIKGTDLTADDVRDLGLKTLVQKPIKNPWDGLSQRINEELTRMNDEGVPVASMISVAVQMVIRAIQKEK